MNISLIHCKVSLKKEEGKRLTLPLYANMMVKFIVKLLTIVNVNRSLVKGDLVFSQGLLYHRTCRSDFLCSWPSLNSYLK